MKKPLLITALAAATFIAGIYVWRAIHAPVNAAASVHHLQYQCPMHPQIIRDEPGECPICHMRLQLMEQSAAGPGTVPDHRIVNYRNPMDPTVFSDKPMKDPMGMDYVPVYADETGAAVSLTPSADAMADHAAFNLSPGRRQLIGVRSQPAELRELLRTLRLPGRVGEDTRQIMAQGLEMDAGLLKSGLEAMVWVGEDAGRKARVSSVDRALDSYSRTFGVRLTVIGGPGADWRPGMYGDVRVTLKLGSGITVPKEAVQDTGEHQWVFVEEGGGHFEPRAVQLGRIGDDFVEIRQGVAAGEQVVTSAAFLIDSESRFQAAAQSYK